MYLIRSKGKTDWLLEITDTEVAYSGCRSDRTRNRARKSQRARLISLIQRVHNL